jgi:hypothetical protein
MVLPQKSPTSLCAAHCDFCSQPIPSLDFGEGRAAVLSGKNCCADCAQEGAWIRSGLPVPEGVLLRRATPRYLPSVKCALTIRLPGWRGLLARNLSLQWLDVSEGGLRALVRRSCEGDDRLSVRIAHRSSGESYAVLVRVRHAQESAQVPGAYVAGMQFENPSEKLREFIRRVHSPAVVPQPGKPPAGKASPAEA